MLLRPAEIKQFYKISHTTLFEAETKGHITPVRTPGGHRRYHQHDIDALLKANASKDAIGYAMQLHFDNYEAMPEVVKIVGHTKPSKDTIGVYLEDEAIDWDLIPCLDLGTYKRVPLERLGDKTYHLHCHPRVKELVKTSIPRRIVFKGSQDTGLHSDGRNQYCNYLRRDDGALELTMTDLMRAMSLDSEKHSDELPLYFTSLEATRSDTGEYVIRHFIYCLEQAR